MCTTGAFWLKSCALQFECRQSEMRRDQKQRPSKALSELIRFFLANLLTVLVQNLDSSNVISSLMHCEFNCGVICAQCGFASDEWSCSAVPGQMCAYTPCPASSATSSSCSVCATNPTTDTCWMHGTGISTHPLWFKDNFLWWSDKFK